MSTETATAVAAPSRMQRPSLTAEQKQALLSATAELIHATVSARPPQFEDPTLAGANGLLVSGAFVSLKRGKHLRGCCGGLHDRPITLGQAVYEATVRTVQDDIRFPPVSACELEHLHLEVWLLFNPEPMEARGEERVRAVDAGGRHGLIVARGGQRGLLLPGVPVDHGWDSEKFLEQVCVKAGLHPSLWKDDETMLSTFEGEALRSRLAGSSANGERAALLTHDQLVAYADFCRANIQALLTGALPHYYLPAAPDFTISGAVLTVHREQAEPLQLTQIQFRPGVPLQATLYALAQTAAHLLASKSITLAEVGSLKTGVTLFNDPALHGTVAEPDLRGIDVATRAILVMERGQAGIAFDPALPPEQLLSKAVEQAQVHTAAAAAIFSVEAVTTESTLSVSTAPRPQAGQKVRPNAVAGRFYPAEPGALEQLLDQLLQGEGRPESWPAAMVPHAGLIYSGRLAALVLKRLQIPPTVIIIGPKHTSLGTDWSVAPHETWAFPGGSLPSDPALARRLADAIPGLTLDAAAHQHEHAIEVELPFIHRLAPDTKVVGIAIGHADLAGCRRFASGLANVLRAMDPAPLLLISSDMNHFATDAETRRLDAMALAALDSLDPEELHETVTRHHISMCGVLPAVIILETLRRLGRLKKTERVGYATSGDVSRDRSRVVGYAGVLIG